MHLAHAMPVSDKPLGLMMDALVYFEFRDATRFFLDERFSATSDVFIRGKNDMSTSYTSVILYHDSDPDISEALLRCRDLVAFLTQNLYPGADATGQRPDPGLSWADPPSHAALVVVLAPGHLGEPLLLHLRHAPGTPGHRHSGLFDSASRASPEAAAGSA